MKGKTVYIVHGYMAVPSDNWFGWLAECVEQAGGCTHIMQMPRSDNPDARRWVRTLSDKINNPDENTYIVAHSLGCIATLCFLAGLGGARIGGLILASGFEDILTTIPELDGFIQGCAFDADVIKSIVEKRVVYVSLNDDVVDPQLTKKLASSIDAAIYEVEGGGHFLASEGYDSFPQIWDKLQDMITDN